MRSPLIRVLTCVTTVLLASACSDDEAKWQTGASPSPRITLPAGVAIGEGPNASPGAPKPTGDLFLTGTGNCSIVKDSKGALWLKPSLALKWLGATVPSSGYTVTESVSGKTISGKVGSVEPFAVALGGDAVSGNAYLGKIVPLTITVDPANDIAEFNESNNVTRLAITVPANPPTDTAEHEVPCQ